MKLIAYMSEPVAKDDVADTLEAVYRISKKNNPDRGIMGVLFFTGSHFLQVIEGPTKAVDELMRTIKLDTRHSNVDVLFESPISSFALTDWNMQPLDLSDQNKFGPEQLKKAIQLTQQSMKLDADALVFMLTELLSDENFQGILKSA